MQVAHIVTIRLQRVNKFLNSGCVGNCDPGKFTTKFSQTLSNNPISHTVFTEKHPFQKYTKLCPHAHNNQYLT
jgi:hypothetical protein